MQVYAGVCVVSCYVFGVTLWGIEARPLAPLADALTTRLRVQVRRWLVLFVQAPDRNEGNKYLTFRGITKIGVYLTLIRNFVKCQLGSGNFRVLIANRALCSQHL